MNNIYILFFVFLCSVSTSEKPVVDKVQEQKAFELLNKIRQNPKAYYKEYHFNLKATPPRPKLKWNETLNKVAEQKALDMATKNYFAHIDPNGYGMNYYINKGGYVLNASWLTDKSDNFFESLYNLSGGDATGEDAIKDLIIDKGTPSLGHRYHLLGIDEWNSSLEDIGIGFARKKTGESKWDIYVCVIIAKHK